VLAFLTLHHCKTPLSGVYTWADGSKYEGEWRSGVKHGIHCTETILVLFKCIVYYGAAAAEIRRHARELCSFSNV
jgi:hypothetical protein